MPTTLYSYKLRRDVPMLDEEEWKLLEPLLAGRLQSIQTYRRATGVSLDDARRDDPVGQQALTVYNDLTGACLDHPDQLFAVRRADYGDPCPACGKPFRTPRAKICAECGSRLRFASRYSARPGK